MEINRRNFLAMTPALLLTPELLPTEADATVGSGKLVCRWEESHYTHNLLVGRDEDLDKFQNYGAMLEGFLWGSFDGKWTFRFGRFFHTFDAASVDGAKQLSEQFLVDDLRQILIEVERLAFRIRRNDE